MLSLLQPAYLIGLLGLIIPLAIHLWNKKEGKVLKIGTIRWMEKNVQSRASRIEFHDWLLFILRCAIITLVVLMLAALAWKEPVKQGTKKWALIDAEISLKGFENDYLNTLEKRGFEIRRLNYGFSKIDLPQAASTDAPKVYVKGDALNIWKIVKAATLAERLPDSMLVLTRGYQKNFSGKKPETSIPTNWITIPDKEPHFFIHETRLWAKDSITLKIGKSRSDYTLFSSFTSPLGEPLTKAIRHLDPRLSLNLTQDTLQLKKVAEIIDYKTVEKVDTLRVFIGYTAKSKAITFGWEAALKAISKHQQIPVEIILHHLVEDSLKAFLDVDWAVNLTEDAFDIQNIEAKIIFSNVFPKDSLNGDWFIKQKSRKPEIFSINYDFQSYNVPEQSLPEALLEVLEKNAEAALWLNDKRTLEADQVEMPFVADERKQANMSETLFSTQKLDPYMWMLVIILLATERMIATGKDNT